MVSPAATVTPSVTPTATPTESDWRAEYYRNIRIDVPASWGYDYELGNRWCHDDQPSRPYVSRGLKEDAMYYLCTESAQPTSTWVERVILTPSEETDTLELPPSESWWIEDQRIGDARVRVVTKDPAIAKRIMASARIADDESGCAPTSPVQTISTIRPPAFDLSAIAAIDEINICQYDTVTGPNSTENSRGGLRAAARVRGAKAAEVLAAIKSAPESPGAGAECAFPYDLRADFALVLRLHIGSKVHGMYVIPRGCNDISSGGIDDGRTVRMLTRQNCLPLFIPSLEVPLGTKDAVREVCEK